VAPTSLKASKLQVALQNAARLHQAGRSSEAEEACRKILRERPSHAETNFLLGVILKGQSRVADAEAAFRRAAAVAPESVAAHNNLGNALFEQGKLDEAEASYRRALALKPDAADALLNLGLVLVDKGLSTDSIPWFRRHAEFVYSRPGGAGSREPIPLYKTLHDQEQRDYLSGLGIPGSVFHLEEGDRLPGRALNPDVSAGEIETRWLKSSPQIAVIDNLLADEALERVRRFCWTSTVWHRCHPNGYLGAMPEHGFACPLLAQISDELRNTYPAIVRDHPLLRWWGFKYDSRLHGINIHADFAAVNVNIWITPDEANLDPESGGLVIWDKPAPLDWTFAQYNSPNAGVMIRSFLAQNGAKSVTVPYRANRAVIFDSDLFHETDRIKFREGYTNRRINITMLYGLREAVAQ
jgi:TPR repeat/Tetratricopeptide repeat